MKPIVEADKRLSIRIEACEWMVDMKEREMIPPLAIFGCVINSLPIDFNFSNAQIPLEVGHVVERIPQAELNVREELQLAWSLRMVFERELHHFTIKPSGTKASSDDVMSLRRLLIRE